MMMMLKKRAIVLRFTSVLIVYERVTFRGRWEWERRRGMKTNFTGGHIKRHPNISGIGVKKEEVRGIILFIQMIMKWMAESNSKNYSGGSREWTHLISVTSFLMVPLLLLYWCHPHHLSPSLLFYHIYFHSLSYGPLDHIPSGWTASSSWW